MSPSVEPRAQLRSVRTRVDGLSIHTLASADPAPGALPVVLVHGYGVSGRYMVPIARRIAAELPVWVPDLPGHGRSEKPEQTLDVPGLARALRGFLDAVGVPRAAFLANSMGCQTVAELAVRHPETVDRLIFVGPTADPETRTLHQHLPRFLRAVFEERPSLIPLAMADYLRFGPRRIVEELRAMFADRIEEKLPEISAPAMVVHGERDFIVPRRWAAEVARLLRTDRLFAIPGAGHALNYSAPDKLMRLIRPFLSEPCSGPRGAGAPSPGGRGGDGRGSG
ncbi:MAG TPA: alpha/beta hydrolase [Thermoanaerobaculia bacterium]|nr:alpha/beta hydrolase [Thermoanaerobaculia bacterium]